MSLEDVKTLRSWESQTVLNFRLRSCNVINLSWNKAEASGTRPLGSYCGT